MASFEEPRISLVPLGGCKKPKLGDEDSKREDRGGGARHDSCVLHPNECTYDFVNPLDLNVMIDHPTCNSVGSTPIGHCGSVLLGDKRQCAITPDACKNPDSWIQPSHSMSQYVNVNSGCTILQDLNYNNARDYHEGGGLTRYIGCKGGDINNGRNNGDGNDGYALGVDGAVTKDGAICVTTVSECWDLIGDTKDSVGESSASGSGVDFEINTWHPECDCSKTRTGACFRIGDVFVSESTNEVLNRYFCAVSEEVCDTELGLSYQDVNQLMRYSDIDCRLCDAGTVMDYKIAVSKIKASSNGTAAIFGIAIGSAIGSALLVTLLHYLCSFYKRQNEDGSRNANRNTNKPPTTPADVAAADLALQEDGTETSLAERDDAKAKVHDAEFS